MEWNEPLEPNGIVRYYVITFYESDSSLANNRTQENSTSANRSRTIGRLEPFTNYSVIVQAVTVEPGSASEVAVVRTNESGKLEEKNENSKQYVRGLSLKFNTRVHINEQGKVISLDVHLYRRAM